MDLERRVLTGLMASCVNVPRGELENIVREVCILKTY